MRNLKLIIFREYLARVKNKTFVVMTFLSPVIMVGMIALIAYLSSINSDENKIVAIHDTEALFLQEFQSTDGITYLDYSGIDLSEAKDSVLAKEYYGLLYFPSENSQNNKVGNITFYGNEAPGNSFIEGIEQKINTLLTHENLVKSGVNLQKIADAQSSLSLRIENFSGEQTSKMTKYVKMFFGGVAGYLLMMFIIIYGNMVMRSVIEEKANRIIEIIISSVRPIQLMLGKILGTSFAGITQFLIWVVLGSILMLIATPLLGIDTPDAVEVAKESNTYLQSDIQQLILDISKLPLGTLVICFLIYFIGGYFLYSSIYAAIGAAVDNETDTQQFMLPVILPLMLGIYVGFFSVIDNPHGVVSMVFSYIPLTSPIVMLMRIPFGVAWWEVVLSVTILVASVFFVIWLAAKIYRVGILMYGKKPSYKELYKWLKY